MWKIICAGMRRIVAGVLAAVPLAIGAQTLQAPDQFPIDQNLEITVAGSVPDRSFVTIVAPDVVEGAYEAYAYVRAGKAKLRTPAASGQYQIRLLGPSSPYPTLASRALEVTTVVATLATAPSAEPGALVQIDWQGPSGSNEYITIVPAGADEGSYGDYVYTRRGSSGTLSLTAPTEPGAYEVRYLSGSANRTLASTGFEIKAADAAMVAAATAGAGSKLRVSWRGPEHARNYITIVRPDAALGEYGDYVYAKSSPVELNVPEQPGEYEIRFYSADSKAVFARSPLRIVAAHADLEVPAEVEADAEFQVNWLGPDNDLDYLAVTRAGRSDQYLAYSYSKRGNPALLKAPEQPGSYEVHYLTGRGNRSLASRKLEVVAGAASGWLRVVAAAATAEPGTAGQRAVMLVLDASGSMLQKLGGKRRIELAREALIGLLDTALSGDDALALRVFGHRKADACDTELVVPLAAGQRDKVRQQLAGMAAKNLARTPIAASLAGVRSDLAAHPGPAVIVLLTDGEETCGGDPVAEIDQLRASGRDVVVNVVGFAVDEHAVVRDFQRWAAAGGGSYLSAPDGDSLGRSLRQAIATRYSVERDGKVVAHGLVGGPQVKLPVGSYRLRAGDISVEVEVVKNDEVAVRL